MKIDFSTTLLTVKGEPLTEGQGEDKKEITLGDASIGALMIIEKGIKGIEKYNRYKLSEKISSGKLVDLKVEEVAQIKKLIGEVWGPAVVGPAWDLLEKKRTRTRKKKGAKGDKEELTL